MEEKYICFAPTAEILSLIKEINDSFGGQDMGQQAALQQAVMYLTKYEGQTEEIEKILRRAARSKIKVRQNIGELPKSLKIRIDKNAYEKAERLFMDALGLVRIRTPYFVRVTLMSFLLAIQKENRELGVSEVPDSYTVTSLESAKDTEKLQRVRMYGLIAEMLLRSAPEDEIYIQEIIKIVQKRDEGGNI